MTRLERFALAADLQRAYVDSLADCTITVNTEGVVTSHWPAWMAREFLLAPSAPAPVLALLDAAGPTRWIPWQLAPDSDPEERFILVSLNFEEEHPDGTLYPTAEAARRAAESL